MIGLGLSVVQIAVRQLLGFDPKSLFAASEPGVWYDPSDIKLGWRYNLLTKTEQFDDAAWQKNNATVTANAAVAPDGVLTADRLVTGGAMNSLKSVSQSFSAAAATYTLSIYAKDNGAIARSIDVFFATTGLSATVGTNYNFDTNTLTNYSTPGPLTFVSSSRAFVGNGWNRIETTITVSSAQSIQIYVAAPYQAAQIGDYYIWGASLTTAENASLPYQRITDGVADYFTYQPQPVLFQDAAGTTPVTAVEQPVGLILDKSKGLVLGPELVTNGTFDSGTTGWIAGPSGSAVTLSVVNQRLRLTKTSTAAFGSAAQQITGLDASKRYKFSCNGYVGSAEVRVLLGTSVETGGIYSGLSSATDIAPTFFVTGVNSFWITVLAYGGNGTYAEFDNISVRELPGNHATQTTATSRPVLSARYNLLTKTQEFDDAAWSKSNSTVTANTAVAPDGTLTADRLFENTATSSHFCTQGQTLLAGVLYKVAAQIKADGRNFAWIGMTGGAAGLRVGVDLITGQTSIVDAFGNYSNTSASATLLSSGFWLIELTGARTSGGSDSGSIQIGLSNSITPATAYTGDGTSGIYIWGASLVPANQASLPYQRVNTATDYDADPSKFKPYLRFDGVDDWLVTPTITPGTDKAQVFAGVRKLSDAAIGVIVEFSASSGSNSGSFGVYAPGSISAAIDDFGATLNGSAFTGGRFNGYDAPTTRVISSLFDISQATAATEITFRANGSSVPSDGVGSLAANAGTGNYLAYPLYIGRRGGTTLPFNGHLYGLIVRFGANLPAATIARTETWLNQRTGAY